MPKFLNGTVIQITKIDVKKNGLADIVLTSESSSVLESAILKPKDVNGLLAEVRSSGHYVHAFVFELNATLILTEREFTVVYTPT